MKSQMATTSPRKVALASLVGTTIEWYDFFIFGTAAALVFNQVFFPSFDPVTGTLAAFGSFAVGFIARPLGGAVFAHYGDRIGRKPMLVYSLLIMGGATVAIGILPGYSAIGIWAPILLVALRFLQGFGIGGEWGGAALMAVEHAPANRRGFYGSWPQVGVPAGLVLGTGTFAALSALLTDDQFAAWGWRIPFLLSAVLIIIGSWIRVSVSESPVFQESARSGAVAKMPVLDALRTYPKEISLAAGSFLATHATFYITSVWLIAYGTTELGYQRTELLSVNTALSLVDIPMIIAFGLLSDFVGRRKLFLCGMGLLVVWGIPYIILVDTVNVWLFAVGGFTIQLCRNAVYGPQSAFFAEQFSPGMRYSGASLAYQFASVFGGMTPLVCTALIAWTGNIYSVGLLVVAVALVSLLCSLRMTETMRRSSSSEDSPSMNVT